ncbi:hypothetical protein GOV07_04345 [Candidatus Woesearchaeota archaeon]|nr:hypothetical protein [Candidatus Woesearchaeota archaeon]
MVDFSLNQEQAPPPRPQMTVHESYNEEEDEVKNSESIDVLVQVENSRSIDDQIDSTGGHAPTNPFNPENPIVVQYNSQQEGPENTYKNEIPGQENNSVAYQGNEQEKDVSSAYHHP